MASSMILTRYRIENPPMKLKHVTSLHTCIFRVTRYQSRYNVLVLLVSLDYCLIVSGTPTLRRRAHLTSMTCIMAPIVVTKNTVPHVLETCGREAYHSPGEDIVVFASFVCRLCHVRDAHNWMAFVDPTLLQVRCEYSQGDGEWSCVSTSSTRLVSVTYK